ncbi:hypothetical protein ACHAXA_003422 [Cyclostephanos tholiformis]|uniref:ELM2 domain-containing protein n=1 Tax=Cyclostephanos tholiformis TaxID=382380 RepID=A0ABD3SFH1_9STRA
MKAQCNGPSPVSSDEEYLTKEEGYRFKSRYGIEGMIPASALPDPNHWEREKNSRERYEMMQAWNSEMGAASKQVELLESLIPHDRKEMALTLFHENDYKINGILDKVMLPRRRLDWSPETRRTFARSITREKSFAAISKRTKKTAGDCQAYYYSSFKGTREYSIVKRHQKTNVRTRSSNVGVSA